jgi:glycosyltransferase involved in cell wall biosynthesis
MNSLVSIVIPALNEEQYLPKLLEDLVAQTVRNFEVVVVDGDSDDKTKEKALSFAHTLPLRVIDSPKRNLSFQRNLGAKNAQSDLIFFLDADARIEPQMLQRLGEAVHSQKGRLYLPYPKPDNKMFFDIIGFKAGILFVRFLDSIGIAYALGPAIVIDKQLFNHIKGFDERAYVSEDQNLIIKARKAKVRPVFLPTVSYFFSMRRFKKENRIILTIKYLIFTIITFTKGAVYTDSITYKMGGGTSKSQK